MITIKIAADKLTDEAIIILKSKLVGAVGPATVSDDNSVIFIQCTLDQFTHLIDLLDDFGSFLRNPLSNQECEGLKFDIVDIHLPGNMSDDLYRLYSSPLQMADTLVALERKVDECVNRIDGSTVNFFEYRSFQHLPSIVKSICDAIKRPDIFNDFAEDIAFKTYQQQLLQKIH